jgi:uncharacterized protein
MFVKYPEKGQVKSRLARDFDEQFVTVLYGNFVDDLLDNLNSGNYRLKIAFYPPEKTEEIRKRFGEQSEYMPQIGADLGERMKNSFHQCFSEGFKSIILIGSDCPDLNAKVIEEAFNVLEKQNDAVIGPACDGGYYLIGFNDISFCHSVFEGPSWGSRSVFADTMNILDACKSETYLAPLWRDIDTRDDLLDLIERHRQTPFSRSRTMTFIYSHLNHR